MLRARPPAKLNLTLAVEPVGRDGFHPLRSVFVRIGLSDGLAVDHAAGAAGDSLTVSGRFECPIEGNLVLRALALLRDAIGQPLPALRARLDKQIPVAAGLGGGSSDGAAALALAARAWAVGVAPELRAELALGLGSDVPFFARGDPVALVEGRGGRVTPLPVVSDGAGVLLCISQRPLPTAAVFARHDRLAGTPSRASELTDELSTALRDGLDGRRLSELAPRLREGNDLWPAAASLVPDLPRRRDGLERLTGRSWLMTGSGPTLFAIYPSAQEARAEGDRLSAVRSAALGDALLITTDLDRQPSTGRPA